MRTRALSVAGALALAASLATLPTTMAQAAPEGCHPPTYGVKYKILSASSAPVVTHAWNKVLAPGSAWNRSTTIGRVNSVQASVESFAEATVGADTIIGKAEAKVGTTLKAAGTATRSKSYTEQVSISNGTGRNREYVVFFGTIKHSGRYEQRWCNSSTYQVQTKRGNWKSWTVMSDGTVRCDLSAPNRVSRKAKRLYCN